MPKQTIKTEHAPAAIGPYSQAVVSKGLLFTSGQLPIDPATGKIPGGSIEELAHMVFRNLEAIAKAAGSHTGRYLASALGRSASSDAATRRSA